MKWIIIGLFSGIFFTTFVPQFFVSNTMKTEQTNDLIPKIQYKFAEYSQWPPFLTDPSFDLVYIIIILTKN
jgi:hypothetical protein